MSETFQTLWRGRHPPSIAEFMEEFEDDASCARYLYRQRWPGGFACPKCDGRKARRLRTRPCVWECSDRSCGKQTSLIAGTIMHGTRLPLSTSFLAAYLVATHKKGISALQLWPKIGVGSYKTAWLLLSELRRAMVDPDRRPLSGNIQVDETDIPYRNSDDPAVIGKSGRFAANRILVIGAVEVRDGQYPGRVRLERLDDEADERAEKERLHDFVCRNTLPGSHIVTDGKQGYRGMPGRGHTAIPHSRQPSIPPHVSMRWIHIVFSNLHTWGRGTFHGFRPKHIEAYANEFAFRWNRRRSFDTTVRTLLGIGQRLGRTTYRDIVGDTTEWQRKNFRRIRAMLTPEHEQMMAQEARRRGCTYLEAL